MKLQTSCSFENVVKEEGIVAWIKNVHFN
ncbi:unnamed protein product [Spirodela intermedia]|uniref:Uncharacterized protein n=1 Tax=Spirodela intermedia TaxID=51605 RepID=A0A7I8K1M2_SPIIN|nr:unnamed protein product [Spirodela intermedia]